MEHKKKFYKLKKYCFDIDGIICKTKNGNYKNSKPNKKIINLINKLYKNNIIILYTARFMGRTKNNKKKATNFAKKLTIDQLKNWKLNYHEIYFAKPAYDFVIDDKSIFVNQKINTKIQDILKKNVKL